MQAQPKVQICTSSLAVKVCSGSVASSTLTVNTARSFGASVCEVSLRACASAFETSVQAHLKVQICSSTLAVKLCSCSVALLTVKLCCRSVAASTLAAKLRVRSQQSLESTRSFDRTRSFAATIVEASTHSSGSKLRYTHSFSFFRRNRSTVLASLTRADVSVTRLGGHCGELGVKPCSNSANFSIRRSQHTV